MQIFVAGATGVIGCSLLLMLIREGHIVFAMISNESQVEAIKKVGAIPEIAGREASNNKAHKECGWIPFHPSWSDECVKYHKNPLMGILVTFTIKGLDCNEYTF
ncbi:MULTISPECIES: hypothetical protein [Bacillus]|uniref:NmrA-like domain-containing protein n=1 Tax=Bacillus mycoides TaxID=1405 RepID=A0A3D9VBK1_BACMY|nr:MULTISPECIES: hypothetical protein [Bacillus]RBP28790.1 hypothetical protein DET63_104174 [Bacillus sp. DB-2]REF39122.1 hypothetical protein DET55_10667 [Bacillus mycoides]